MPELTPALAWDLACGGPFPDPAALMGDGRFMAEALREAQTGVGLSSPNPPVGCVLVREGRILGRGAHTRAGDPHGEIMALRDAEARGEDPRGATAFITLEPCCHHGRTPPCTDALIQAAVARVVVGVRDSNPRVDGGGLAILRAQGIEITEGVLGEACRRFHAPFFKFIRTGLPWVSLKLALGVDSALGPEGQRTQVTSPEVQALSHALRRASEAIVVGRRTVEVDDPQLTDRWQGPVPAHRQFWRVVLDSEGQIPSTARVWQPVQGQPALRAVTGEPTPIRGVEDLRLPPDAEGGCSLRHLLHELAARGVGRVLVEGGATLAERLVAQGWVDEVHLFRNHLPMHGTVVRLGLSGDQPWVRAATFPEGTWEIARLWHNS